MPRPAEWVRWERAWRKAGYPAAPWPTIAGRWPTARFDFACPGGWTRAELERAAERVALAAAVGWWELHPMASGRWSLLLDASEWDAPVPLLSVFDEELAIPVGVHPDGPASWDLTRSPHLLVSGATGSGKSSLLRSIVASVPTGWLWRVVVVDPKEIDFAPARHEIEVHGLADAPEVLPDLAALLGRRKEQLRSDGAAHWRDLPERLIPVRPVLLVLDESVDLLGGVGLSKAGAHAVREAVATLVRQGRACGIHVVAAFTRPDTDAVPGAVRDQFGARVALGPLSPDGARMMFGTQRMPSLPDGPPGTGLALGLDGSQRLRRLRVPWATIADVRRRHAVGWATPCDAGSER